MVSAILLTLSLLCACLFGSRFEPWSWGPSLLGLGLAMVACALEPGAPHGWTRKRLWVAASVLPALGWLVWRAARSPVQDYALADLWLMAGMTGAFAWGLTRGSDRRAMAVLLTGLALVVLANAAVAVVQCKRPEFSVLHGLRPKVFPSGLLGHHNYFSNFMIGATVLLAGVAACGRWHGALRFFWGLCALAGWVAIPLSRSRGGTIGLLVAICLLLVLLVSVAKWRWRRGFHVLAVILPLALLAGGLFGVRVVGAIQQSRSPTGGAEGIFGDARLSYIRWAVDSIALHPWQGGGSQSFRWENREVRVHERADQYALHDLLFVHNEALQLVTDYGVIGGVLVGGALVVVLVAGVGGLLLARGRESGDGADLRDGLLAGGLAAMGGMLVQGNFCILYHVFHGPLLLGLLAGLVVSQSGARDVRGAAGLAGWCGRGLLVAAGVAVVPAAWNGITAMAALLPVDRARALRQDLLLETEVAALEKALEAWPDVTLHMRLGFVLQFSLTESGGAEQVTVAERALSEYRKAAARDPHEPSAAVNAARLASLLGHWDEAESEFERAVRLQYGFEPSYGARYYRARHFYQKGWALWNRHDREGATAAFREARADLAPDPKLLSYHPARAEVQEMTAALDAILALVEAEKTHGEAMDLFRARQAPKALAGFLRARAMLASARRLPAFAGDPGLLKLEERNEGMIEFLEGARIKPAP